MKKFFVIVTMCPICSYAATPSTSCPDGFVELWDDSALIAATCPENYVPIGTVSLTSCLSNSTDLQCWMYAPANTKYDDANGVYEYTQMCPL